jgi:NADPH:quinone reductase-like Zn-dependent oxidoreductase
MDDRRPGDQTEEAHHGRSGFHPPVAWELSQSSSPSTSAHRGDDHQRANVDLVKANGGQLREITSLIDAGAIRPVVDRIFPFESTKEALAYVETGRAKGKVVVKIRGA